MKKIAYICALGLALHVSAEAPKKDEKEDNLYSSFGKRDPFKVPDRVGLTGEHAAVDPLRKYRLESYRLRGILRIGNKPKAMFEDPDGKSHVVGEGDRIGMEAARVSRIVNSEVIVTDHSTNYLGKEILLEKVISLPNDGESDNGVTGVVQQGYPGDGIKRSAASAPPMSAPSSSSAPSAQPPAPPIDAALAQPQPASPAKP